jgi:hypothetical protein
MQAKVISLALGPSLVTLVREPPQVAILLRPISWTVKISAGKTGVVAYKAEIPTNAEKLTANFTQLSH